MGIIALGREMVPFRAGKVVPDIAPMYYYYSCTFALPNGGGMGWIRNIDFGWTIYY